MNKTCIYCNITAETITHFYKTKSNTDGFFSYCKKCHVERGNKRRRANLAEYNKKQKERRIITGDSANKKYYSTLRGYIVKTYAGMKNRVNSPKQKNYFGLPILEKEEFYSFCDNSDTLKPMYEKYKESGFDKKIGPSIDRINPKDGYVLGNIRWVTLSENSKYSHVTTVRRFDVMGKKFNRLTVVEACRRPDGRLYYKCVCDCGNITYADASSLVSGTRKGCGCKRPKKNYKNKITPQAAPANAS